MKTKPAAKKDLPEMKNTSQELFEKQFLKAWKENGCITLDVCAIKGIHEVDTKFSAEYSLCVPGHGRVYQVGSAEACVIWPSTFAPRTLLPALSDKLRDSMKSHFQKALRERMTDGSSPYSYFPSLIEALKKA